MPQTVWTETLQSHLELALQVAQRLPEDEKLTAENLNRVLELLEQVKETFLLQCELQGFKTTKENP